MKCTIEWKEFGTLQDIYVYGYNKTQFNEPPMLYATLVKPDTFKSAIKNLVKRNKIPVTSGEAWKEDVAQLLQEILQPKGLNIDMKNFPRSDPALLYIDKTDRNIAYRLVEDFDPGSSIPLYLLDIRASDVMILTGNIIDVDEELQKIEDVYGLIAHVLILRNQPLFYKEREVPGIHPEIEYLGDFEDFFIRT